MDHINEVGQSAAEDKICEHCGEPMSAHPNAKRMDAIGITKGQLTDPVITIMLQYGINPLTNEEASVAIMDAFVSGAEWYKRQMGQANSAEPVA